MYENNTLIVDQLTKPDSQNVYAIATESMNVVKSPDYVKPIHSN